MRMFLKAVALLGISAFSCAVAIAATGSEDRAVTARAAMHSTEPGQPCAMTEQAYINISFNQMNVDLADLPSVFNKKVEAARTVGKDMGIEKIEIENYSYNIYNNGKEGQCCGDDCVGPDAGGYQGNGNVNLSVVPSERAQEYTAALIKKGYTVNLNVNAYKQCGNNSGE